MEEQANNSMTPKAGRWTKREDDLLRSAVDEYGAEVRIYVVCTALLSIPSLRIAHDLHIPLE